MRVQKNRVSITEMSSQGRTMFRDNFMHAVTLKLHRSVFYRLVELEKSTFHSVCRFHEASEPLYLTNQGWSGTLNVDVLDRTADKIRESLFKETRRQAYPLQPSRLGYVYILSGISHILHQYWNRISSSHMPKLNIYVDVSPSMHPYREKEVFLIDRLKDLFPTTFFVFGSGVKEFSVADFSAGKYPIARSTDFNPVIEHLMASDVECGVVFTDGESYVTPENRLKLRRSGKRLFVVYFNDEPSRKQDGSHPIRSDLDKVSEKVMQIDLFERESPLTHRILL